MQIQNQIFTSLDSSGGGPPVETFYRITESGDRRVTEDGNPRILE